MQTFITIALTSTVISALISGIVSLHMKRKELEVKLKLEEKNKWIENINKAHKDYMDSTTNYMNDLMIYALNKVKSEDITNRLNIVNKTSNSLIFFMYQSEYNLSLVQEAQSFMQKNNDSSNEQRKIAILYRNKKIDKNELKKKMGEAEDELGKNNYEFSKKLGIMILEEKKEMTNEIIKRSFFRSLLPTKK